MAKIPAKGVQTSLENREKFSEAGWYKRRIVSVIENSGENYTTAMTSYIIRQNGLINLLLYKKTFLEIIAVC
jgi:hypothetical protein